MAPPARAPAAGRARGDSAASALPLLARFLPDADASDVDACTLADVRANIERLLRTTSPLAAHLRGADAVAGRAAGPARAAGRRPGAERSRTARSVLAYGMPELIGRLRDGVGAQAFCAALRDALLDHEPRLDPASLSILVDDEAPDRSRLLTGEFGFSLDARVRGLDGARGRLRVRTVVHPFRAPEVDVSDGRG